MAVTSTSLDILVAAYARSSKNIPGTIATEATELLALVGRAMTGLYAFAARINPCFFADQSTISFAAPGWRRPEAAESVFRIETPAGAEVVVVPYFDRKAEEGLPAVYRLGQVYRSAGNVLDPINGDLTFFYAKRPEHPLSLNDPLDDLWVESYNALLVDEVAIYLALKDGRNEELGELKASRDSWAQLFAAFLEHETANERRRYGIVQRFTTNSVIPIGSLLAGGSAVRVAA